MRETVFTKLMTSDVKLTDLEYSKVSQIVKHYDFTGIGISGWRHSRAALNGYHKGIVAISDHCAICAAHYRYSAGHTAKFIDINNKFHSLKVEKSERIYMKNEKGENVSTDIQVCKFETKIPDTIKKYPILYLNESIPYLPLKNLITVNQQRTIMFRTFNQVSSYNNITRFYHRPLDYSLDRLVSGDSGLPLFYPFDNGELGVIGCHWTSSAVPFLSASINEIYEKIKKFTGSIDGLKIKDPYNLLSGDINQDGIVDTIDLSILSTNYGKSGINYFGGDLNQDGKVDIRDLSILASNYGKSNIIASKIDFLKKLYESGDITKDGKIDDTDIYMFKRALEDSSLTWYDTDLNKDGVTDDKDLQIILENLNKNVGNIIQDIIEEENQQM